MKALKIQSDMAKKAAQTVLGLLYYGSLILFLWNNTMGEATGFGYLLDHAARRVFWIIFFGISAAKMTLYLASGERPKRESLFLILFGTWILLIRTQWNEVLDETFLFCPVIAMGAVGEKEERLLKVWFWVKLLIILECYAGAAIGLVSYITEMNNGQLDHAFGFAHKNTLGMELFMLLVLGWCAYPKKANLYTIAGGILGAFFCRRYVGSDTGTIMLLLTVVTASLFAVAQFFTAKTEGKHTFGKWFGRILSACYFACTLFSVILVQGYGSEETRGLADGLFHRLDKLLHKRLQYPWAALERYEIKPFGQMITMNTIHGDDYFFLDNSYYYLLFQFGWVIWLVIGLISVLMMLRYARQKQWRCFLGFLLICVQSIEECYFFQLRDNIWLILPACLLFSGARTQTEEKPDTADTEPVHRNPIAILRGLLGGSIIPAILLFLAVFLSPLSRVILWLAETVRFESPHMIRMWWTLLYGGALAVIYAAGRLCCRLVDETLRKTESRTAGQTARAD